MGFYLPEGLAFDASTSTLYGTDIEFPYLFTIDETTGLGTTIGNTPRQIFGLAHGTRSITGTYSGVYDWTCGSGGSSPLQIGLVDNAGVLSGTA